MAMLVALAAGACRRPPTGPTAPTPRATVAASNTSRCSPGAEDGLPIIALTIEGQHRMSREDIRSYLASLPGRRYTRARLDEDVVALYNTGHFWQAGAVPTCRGDEISIRIVAREWPLIKNVRVNGNGTKCAIDRGADALASSLEEAPGKAMNLFVLAGDGQRLRDACHAAGHRVEARPVVSFVGPNEVDVIFELSAP
jgi:outer membrane protein assembly factor BamA